MVEGNLEGANILITGGAGFIGSHLCEKIVSLGANVICVDNFTAGSRENISSLLQNKQFKLVEADVNNPDQTEEVFKEFRPNFVFHYAAIVGVRRNVERPLDVFNDIHGIENIARFSREYKVKKIVFASSSEVYGDPKELPEREDGAVNPQLPYGITKLFGEKLLRAYYQKFGLRSCSLRFFNVYGPRQEGSDYGFVIGIFIERALRGEPPIIYGDGMQTRDFVYIDDNIEVSLKALLSESTDGEVINVGTGRPVTILEVGQKVLEISENALPIIFAPPRPYDVRHRWPDISKMWRILGYRPKTTLDDGLKLTLEAYKNKSSG
jgi:UDP-glucose 4-epimerase